MLGSFAAVKQRPLNLTWRTGGCYSAVVRSTFLAALALVVTCPTATAAEPDSARIASLRFVLMSFDDVRVVTDSTDFVSRDVVPLSAGLRLRTPSQGSSSGQGLTYSGLPRERLVPWSRIESIQVRKGGSGGGILVGAVVGLALGFAIYAAEAPVVVFSLGQTQPNPAPIFIGALGGAAFGGLLSHAGPWHTVFP